MEIAFYSGPTCMPDKGINSAVGHMGGHPSLVRQDCRVVSPVQGGDWKALSNTLGKNKLGLVLFFFKSSPEDMFMIYLFFFRERETLISCLLHVPRLRPKPRYVS